MSLFKFQNNHDKRPKEWEKNESPVFKVEHFKCNHGCNQSFKTKRQMILHHDKIDNFCSKEKKLLINLIENYKKSVEKILSEGQNPNLNKYKNTDEYQYLQKQLNRTYKLSVDKIQLQFLFEEEE